MAEPNAKVWLRFLLCDIIDAGDMMVISSAANPVFKDLLKLKQKKYRTQTGTFLVEGEHLVREAIQSGSCLEVIAGKDVSWWNGKTTILENKLLQKLSDVEASQEIFALCRIPRRQKQYDRLLILDGIQDPGNLGTLFRSALAFGFDMIVMENTVDPLNPKVLRASQGAIFRIDWLETEIISYMDEHPEYLFFGTDVANGSPLKSYVPSRNKIGLILGNEGVGIRQSILEKTAKNLKIEMEDMESLNVGVAGAIIMYHLRGDK